jgi:hypothetical protein
MASDWRDDASDSVGNKQVLIPLAVVVCVLAGVALYLWPGWEFDDWFYRTYLSNAVFVIGIPAGFIAAYVLLTGNSKFAPLGVFVAFGAIVLLFAGNIALRDADTLRNHNCWVIRGDESEENATTYWECAPTGGWPYEWSGSNEEGYSSRYCSLVETWELDEYGLESRPNPVYRCSREDG